MNELKHLAIIMDGNGRWAEHQGLIRSQGHLAGAKNLKQIIKHVLNCKIQTLSLFAFSTENWNRPQNEVDLIMKLFLRALKGQISFFSNEGIKVKVIGDRSKLGSELVQTILEVENATINNQNLNLILAINYSGQFDICQAIKSIPLNEIENLTTDKFSSYLLTSEYPFPDLIIRTGNENRISNFFLWQAAYSEFQVESKYWPDFNSSDLDRHIAFYKSRHRRFGKVS